MLTRSDTTAPKVEESRGRPRRRMLKHVQVLSLDKKAISAIDCTLRNISRSGAQLFGPQASISRIPSQLYLVAPGQLRMILCTVVWKTYDTVGISFVSDPGHSMFGSDGMDERELNDREAPPDGYALDRTTGAVVRLDDPASCTAPDSEFRELERTVSEALGLKVEIFGAASGSRVVLHVPLQQLNDVCRYLARQD